MDDRMEELARRVRDCWVWSFAPGMEVEGVGRIYSIDEDARASVITASGRTVVIHVGEGSPYLPDLSDRATIAMTVFIVSGYTTSERSVEAAVWALEGECR